jgi:hypothetical protein
MVLISAAIEHHRIYAFGDRSFRHAGAYRSRALHLALGG